MTSVKSNFMKNTHLTVSIKNEDGEVYTEHFKAKTTAINFCKKDKKKNLQNTYEVYRDKEIRDYSDPCNIFTL